MNEVLSTIAAEEKFQNVAFTKVEAETYPEISQKFNIAAVPTFIFIKNTTEVDRLDGADAPELSKKVEKHANSTITLPSQPAAPVQDLNTRLKTLINSAPCMVFMKGVPDQPRCGFSKTLMQILRDNSIKFSSFNILEDEEVRQGLKKFSDWPTYPQVYVNGELIGGLDIIKEMAESGSLLESMPKQESLNDRLKSLINQSDVVLFMKGDPETPRCGFSKQTIAILDETGVPYTTFDILKDEEVRQGLKKYSDWPTYPQLYAKGELIGGLDIIKELVEGDELETTLKGS